MIVIGVDPHKVSHTAAVVEQGTGRLVDELTVSARRAGYRQLLEWASGVDAERVWAVEFGRHVAGGLERHLVLAGEHVVRVPPKLMAAERRGARTAGKSDAIDALAVARAAIREPNLPVAHPEGPEREIALLVQYRDELVADHTRITRRLRWLLHDLDPDLEPPSRSLSDPKALERLARRLRTLPATTQVRICREQLVVIRDLVRRSNTLQRELAALVARRAPALLELRGCGPLSAARILADVGDITRFPTDAHLASYAGISPLDASSGKQQRHRLNRRGNRKLNRALHIIAVTQARIHPEARDYLARRTAAGKTNREALRALKRHLIRVIHRILTRTAAVRNPSIPGAAPLTCLT